MSQMTARVERELKVSPFSDTSNVAEIRERMSALITACEKGDINQVMSFYAPDAVVYDCPPKLRLRGREEYRQSFDKWFTSMFEFPVKYESREERIVANGDLAVVHGLMNVRGKFKESGEEMSVWLRHTTTFEKMSGVWLITHEHFSVPIDENGQALMELNPEKDRAV